MTNTAARSVWRPRRIDRAEGGDLWAALLIGIAGALVNAGAMFNDFTLDDDTVIQKRELVHHLSGVWRAFAHPYWPETTPAGQYRPLAIGSFAIDWMLSGGSPHWMHAVNVVWHVAACLLVWRLLRELVGAGGALAGALYFAVQPVHVEAIASTVGRCDLMAATFVLAGVLAHRRGAWVAVPLYAAALASKESGVVMLGLVAVNDLLFGVSPAGAGLEGRLAAVAPSTRVALALRLHALHARRRLYAGYLGVVALYGAVLMTVFWHRPFVDIAPAWFHTTVLDRWLTQAQAVPEYVRLLVIPFSLKLEYSPRVIEVARTVTPAVVVGLLLLAMAVVGVLKTWRTVPVVSFAILWFAVAVSPVSNVFFASGVVLAERTLYLPSVGAAIGVAWGVAAILAHASSVSVRRWAVVASGGAVLVAYVGRTWTRARDWHDDKTLLLASMLAEPESYRTHVRAALILDHRGDWQGALREFANARTLYPEDSHVYEAAAMVEDMHNQFGPADQLYDSAAHVTPEFDVYIKQARLRYRFQDYAGAIAVARAAYLTNRDSVEALNIMTGAAQHLGDFASAEWAFQHGLVDHPRDTTLHRQYSWMLAAKGDTAASRREALRATAR
jgi:tetratricopeptide (TPR) repeat protein